MQDRDIQRRSILASADLRTEKRKEGEALQAFEKIVDRFVPLSAVRGRDKPSPKLKRTTRRPHEIVLWEANDP